MSTTFINLNYDFMVGYLKWVANQKLLSPAVLWDINFDLALCEDGMPGLSLADIWQEIIERRIFRSDFELFDANVESPKYKAYHKLALKALDQGFMINWKEAAALFNAAADAIHEDKLAYQKEREQHENLLA